MASRERPARHAAKEAFGALRHWSSVVSAVAVVVVAHWLAIGGGSSNAGLVFGASFAVFALLLPAVSLVREYVDRRRTPRLQEVLRSDTTSAETLESQRRMFGELAQTVAPLQRGIVLAVLAAIASSMAIIAPSVTVGPCPAVSGVQPCGLPHRTRAGLPHRYRCRAVPVHVAPAYPLRPAPPGRAGNQQRARPAGTTSPARPVDLVGRRPSGNPRTC